MKTVIAALAALLIGFTGSALAVPGGKFFDPNTKQWVSYGPSHGGKSPIRRKMVSYDGPYEPGTIVVDTEERRLYHIQPGGKAMRYGVGVGREGFQWAGTHRITRKAEWPGWTPPPQMRARERAKGRILPAHMEGGPNNPLGARALYIGSTLYRIHGTNEPWTIGSAVSSGCIRLANEDIKHLYSNVSVGSRVVVKR
ncbi:L,D-transpeptidase [Roseibium aquae]|nr:L,D-transpeptidase [Roseibium aquae]